MGPFVRSTLVACSLFAFASLTGFAQSATSTEPAPAVQSGTQPSTSANSSDSGRFGAAVKVSLLGIGGEAAVAVTHRTNVRAGFNMISYSRGFDKDGISYNGQLNFKTFEAHYDIFPWAKSFHISPGVLVYAADPNYGNGVCACRAEFQPGRCNVLQRQLGPSGW